YVPRHGVQLADEVLRWSEWISAEATRVLAKYFPRDDDGSVPTAYLWARTIQCEGPGCGVQIPLIRPPWLVLTGDKAGMREIAGSRDTRAVAVRIADANRGKKVPSGTIRQGTVTCPLCDFTTPVVRVREQLRVRGGGAYDARLICVVRSLPGRQGKSYRVPTV